MSEEEQQEKQESVLDGPYVNQHRIVANNRVVYQGGDWGHASRVFIDHVHKRGNTRVTHEVVKIPMPRDLKPIE